MNTSRVQSLIEYILAEAGQDEDWKLRELGPIHIIKYVYLADMYYAMKNDGETYTGIEWQFYNFGPWSPELYREIPNAAKTIGANFRTFESDYAKDGMRWSLAGDSLHDSYYDKAVKKIPFGITHVLKRDIRNFGPATYDLLHYVYTTPPMTHAKPNDYLDFSHAVSSQEQKSPSQPEESSSKLSARAIKKRKVEILRIREQIAKKREEKKKRMVRPAPPRYDEIFFQGTSELSLEVELSPLENHKGVLQVNPSAWGSDWRKNIDLP